MNSGIELFLCAIAWAFTLGRLKAVQWRNIGKDNGIALNVWFMMFLFSVTLTFLGGFGDSFDAHTFNNLSQLIAYPSILVTIYLAARESLNTIEKSSDKRVIRWLGILLVVTIIILLAIYVLYLWKIPQFINVPRNLPEAIYRFMAFFYGGILCLVVARAYLAYFPLEKSAVLRLRAIMVIMCSFSTGSFFLVRIAQVAGYFWPLLGSPALNSLSIALLVLSSFMFFAAFLSNKIYARFVVIARNIRSWKTLQDLGYLKRQLMRLCPEAFLPATNPSFLSFVFNPEYYLYRVIITIMDGKTLLDDLLAEGALRGEPVLWEGDLLREVVQVKRALQSINPSGDFWEIVDEYRRVSKRLFQSRSQDGGLKEAGL